MPSGRIHTSASILAAGIGVALINGLTKTPTGLAIGYLTGCLAGLVITPDLDMINQTVAHRNIRHFFRSIAALWRLIWLPYAILIPHRSVFITFPLGFNDRRLIYLGVPGALVAYTFGNFLSDRASEIIAYSHNILSIIFSYATPTATLSFFAGS